MALSTLDPATLHLLQHQGRRMTLALHGNEKQLPDRELAKEIQVLVDDILDRRPRPIAVTLSGEVLYEGTSPYVVAQAHIEAGLPAPVNATDEPEVVLPHSMFGSLTGEPENDPGDEIIEGPGGVAVLDREQIRDAQPGDGRKRPPITQKEIDEIRREMEGEA